MRPTSRRMVLSISRDDSAGRGTVHEDRQSVSPSRPFTHGWLKTDPGDQPRGFVVGAKLYGGRLDFDGPVVAGGGDI